MIQVFLRRTTGPAALLAPLLALAGAATPARAEGLRLDLEAGSAWQARNNFAVPNETGTLVRLADVTHGPAFAPRASLYWDVGKKQTLRFLAAPLRLETSYRPGEPVDFQDRTFSAGEPLAVRYEFDSYRVTWMYRFAPRGRWSWRLGATAKVRSAAIRLAGSRTRADETNVGLVPLLHAGLRYESGGPLAVDVEADALAAPQGRAEDLAARIEWRMGGRWSWFAGYRLLEGGADVDKVYSFAWFHYAMGGVSLRF